MPSSIYSDITLRGENISLSFTTNQSPALLLYVSSFYREYLILLINKNGEDSQMAFSLGCLLLVNDCVFFNSATYFLISLFLQFVELSLSSLLCFLLPLCLSYAAFFQQSLTSGVGFEKNIWCRYNKMIIWF